MASIYEQAQKFRADLIKRDTAAIEFLTNQYKEVYARILRALVSLNNQIDETRRSGQTVTKAWLNQQWRYQSFLRQLDQEFRQYSGVVSQTVSARQAFEFVQGSRDASAMIGGQFNQLPVRALQNIVGNLRDTSPLGKLLNSFGADAGAHVAQVLRDAIALGHSPRKIAGQVRDALGVPLHRALLISRTESVRAYRQSSIQQYQAAGIEQWRWTASKSARTCLACLALDGQIFSTEKPFPAHPACRCTMTPVIDDAPHRRETGAQWFTRQPDSVKREMMGESSFAALKSGKVKLQDFVGRSDSRKWGRSYYELSLKRALAGEARFPG